MRKMLLTSIAAFSLFAFVFSTGVSARDFAVGSKLDDFKLSGIDGIALTKLDVLDGFSEVKVCVGYMLDGERIDRLPAGHNAQARVKPIYQTFEGWTQSTRGARSWAELPAQAVKYVRTIEELIECPVTLLSTSPEREDTILMKDPFAD